MPHSTQTFRLFVSSTFSDLKEERDALQEQVFPKLRTLCEEQGCRFQAIDLRWGVSEEAGLDNKTMQICFEEIDRCKRTTPKPNFLVLLGDRYGWRPLPEMIPADEFEEIEQRIADESEKSLMHRWYKRDDNNVPPLYILQPREGECRDYSTWVNQVETPLHSLLERVTSEMDLSEEQRIKYTRSATEQEIVCGALSVPDANEHVFCYFRDILDLEKNITPTTPSDTSLSRLFVDFLEDGCTDEPSRQRIRRLKDQLTSALPYNIRTYHTEWNGGEKIPITLDHIPQLCTDVEMDLTRIIKEQIDTSQTLSPLNQEILAHKSFAEERAKFFIGREDILTTIREYIAGSHRTPLVIFGASGSGKSALIAKAWEETTQEHPDAVIISRFIGATPLSTDIRALLESLCSQIRDVYGDNETPVPSEYNEIVKAFPEWLQKASVDRPLLLFLDALDQLNPQNDAHRLNWIPVKLPPHVSLIVSVMDRDGPQGECLKAARDHLPPNALKQLSPMTSKEGSEILDRWLTAARRMLQQDQRTDIISKFGKNGLPLYLKLSCEEAKSWRSYDALPCGADIMPGLAEDIPGIIRDLFARFEHPANHGQTLVSKALGYLIAAKNGLTEDEMLDVLSLDEEVMNKRSAFWPDADRLPVILWSRLYFDLEPYLAERSADHTSLLSFYHRQIREVAEERYLSGNKKQQAHTHLASYFSKLKNWQKMVPLHFTEDFSKRIPMYRKVSELAYHYAHSRQCEAFYKTLSDFDFIDAKTVAFGPDEMIAEYNIVSRNHGSYSTFDKIHTDTLSAIKRALQLSSYISKQDQSQLACQLYARLKSSGNSELETFCDTIRDLKDRPWLRQVASTLDQAGGELILTFCGHTDQVLTVAVTPDGKHAVSGSKDQCLKVWDLESGMEVATFKGHTSYVTTVAVTPDGKRAVSGSRDKTMKIWDLESGRLLNTLIGHTKEITTVAVTPDGRRAVSGSEDNTLKIWDLESGRELATLSGHSNSVLSVAVTPDGRRAVSGARESSLKVWDIESGRELATLKGVSWNAGVAVTPDGKRVVSGSWNNKLTIWDLIHNCEINNLLGHTSWVTTIAVTPDGRRAVSGSDDNTLKIWDLESCSNRCNDELYTLTGHTSEITTVAVTSDGRRAVSGSRDNTLKVWNLEYTRELNTFTGHTNEVISVAVTPDGRRVVSGSRDNTLKVWDLESGRELHTLSGHTRQVTAVAVRLNGKHVVSGSWDNTLKVWDLESGQELKTLRGHTSVVEDVAVIPGGIAVSGSRDKTLKVWDLESGTELVTLIGHTDMVLAVAVTLDGQCAVSGSRDKTLKIWDILSGCVIHTLTGHTSEVTAVAVTPDGKRIVSGSRDKTLKVWDLKSGQELHTLSGHSNSVLSVAVTPDGKRIVSGSEDNTLKIWDLDFGLELATLSGHARYVAAVAVTPNGKCVVSGSWDKTLKVWSLQSGWKPAILTGHTSYVAAIAVTTNGKRAVTGSWDKTLKVWDLKSGGELHTLTGHTSWVNVVAVTPDGRRAVSGSDDNSLKIWDLESGRELHTLSGHNDEVTVVLITPDGDLAISGSKDTSLKVWDLKSGRELHTLSGHIDEVTAIAVTPDGKWVISGSKDTSLKVWDLESGQELHTLSGHIDEVTAIAVTPCSERAVSGSKDQFLIVWDLDSGKELNTFTRHMDEVTTVLITPDGERAISGSKDKTLKIWDVDFVWDFSTLKGHTNSIYAINIVAITSDGKRAVSGPGNTTLIVWDLDSKKIISTFSVDRAIVACSYSHVVNTIVAGDDSGGMYFLVPENL